MQAITSVALPNLASIIVASSSDSCDMSIASICLSLTTKAARFLPAPDVNTVQERGIPTILLPILYGSCIQITSVSSPFIIFRRLAVASLECWRFICIHFSRVLKAPVLSPCLTLALF